MVKNGKVTGELTQHTNPNDVVKYGGYIYICNTGHTSNVDVNVGLEGDLSKWDPFIEGFDYKRDWAIQQDIKLTI